MWNKVESIVLRQNGWQNIENKPKPLKGEGKMTAISDFIEENLIRIGATPEYTGYKYLLHGLMMAMQDDSILNKVTTVMYPAIGRQFNTGATNVERSIRTVIAAIWCEADPQELKEIMGRSYAVQPGNAKFIAIFSKYLLIKYRRTHGRQKRGDAAAPAGENIVAK